MADLNQLVELNLTKKYGDLVKKLEQCESGIAK
jgi:hypothetical protein